jgi:hypothetical protein
LAKAAARKVTL